MGKHEPETIAFCAQVKVAWMASRKSMRVCAREVGCSHATFSRLAGGKQPDLDTYFKVKRWLAKQGDALEALKQLVASATV